MSSELYIATLNESNAVFYEHYKFPIHSHPHFPRYCYAIPYQPRL